MNAKDFFPFECKFPLLGLSLSGLSQDTEPLLELLCDLLLGLGFEPNIVAFAPLVCEVDDFVFRGVDGDA